MAWMSKQKGKLTQTQVTNTSGGKSERLLECMKENPALVGKVNSIPKSDRVVKREAII